MPACFFTNARAARRYSGRTRATAASSVRSALSHALRSRTARQTVAAPVRPQTRHDCEHPSRWHGPFIYRAAYSRQRRGLGGDLRRTLLRRHTIRHRRVGNRWPGLSQERCDPLATDVRVARRRAVGFLDRTTHSRADRAAHHGRCWRHCTRSRRRLHPRLPRDSSDLDGRGGAHRRDDLERHRAPTVRCALALSGWLTVSVGLVRLHRGNLDVRGAGPRVSMKTAGDTLTSTNKMGPPVSGEAHPHVPLPTLDKTFDIGWTRLLRHHIASHETHGFLSEPPIYHTKCRGYSRTARWFR